MTTILLTAPADQRAAKMFGLVYLIADGAHTAIKSTDPFTGHKTVKVTCQLVDGWENILEGYAASVPGFTYRVQPEASNG